MRRLFPSFEAKLRGCVRSYLTLVMWHLLVLQVLLRYSPFLGEDGLQVGEETS